MRNKRGSGLSINTIILIIIGVLVLGFVIFGFVTGWKIFAGLFRTDNNVEDLVQDCDSACNIYRSQYDYCLRERDLIVDKEKTEGVTCYWLEKKRAVLGFKVCTSGVDCHKANVYEDENIAQSACSGNEKPEPADDGTIMVLIDKAPGTSGSIYKKYKCVVREEE